MKSVRKQKYEVEYIQRMLNESRDSHALLAAYRSYTKVMGSPEEIANIQKTIISTDELGWFLPNGLVTLLLSHQLTAKHSNKTKFKHVQKLFDEDFENLRQGTIDNAKYNLHTQQVQKRNRLLVGLGVTIVILSFCLVAYFMNWEGIFHHDIQLKSDGFFSINMPGNYEKNTNTLGTSEEPIYKIIYKYDNKSDNNRLVFYVTQTDYPALLSDQKINDLFIKSPEDNLIQNFNSGYTGKEVIKEKTTSTHTGYPSIYVTKRDDSVDITTYLRYIKVGHTIYEISLSGDDYFNNYTEIFKRYADSFKVLPDNTIKTTYTQSLAPTLLACDQLPQKYIDQVINSTVTKKEESKLQDGSGTQCWVEGTIASGPNWILTYTVIPTTKNKTIQVDKQNDNVLGTYYTYGNGRYVGTLSFTTQGTSPADEQIGNDLTMELARSLQTK